MPAMLFIHEHPHPCNWFVHAESVEHVLRSLSQFRSNAVKKPCHRSVGWLISPTSQIAKYINQFFKTHTQKDQKLAKLLSPQLFPEQQHFFWSEWVSRLLLVLIADYNRGWRMARWWRSLVLAEGPGLGPSIHSSLQLQFQGSHRLLLTTMDIEHIHVAYTYMQAKKKNLKQIR